MKTITTFIYAAFAVLTFAMGTLTVDGAVNDLFVSVDGTGDNDGGFIYKYAPNGMQSTFYLCGWPLTASRRGLRPVRQPVCSNHYVKFW